MDTDRKTLNRFEKRKRRTRGQLQTSARVLLLEKGYIDLTIQDITDRADLARGTFYVHFDDKDAIVWSLLSESLDILVEQALHGLTDVPYIQRKYQVLVKCFSFARDHRDLLQVLMGEKGHPAFAQRLRDLFADVIAEGIRTGIFRTPVEINVPDTFMTQFMTGALVQLMMWSLETDYSPDQLAQMFFEILFQGAMSPGPMEPDESPQ